MGEGSPVGSGTRSSSTTGSSSRSAKGGQPIKLTMDDLAAPLAGGIKPVRASIFYRLGLLLVMAVMLLLPLIYVSLIGLLGYGIYLHVIHDHGIITAARGRAVLLAVVIYAAPIIAGIIAVLFMIKPFFAPRHHPTIPLSLEREEQPALFLFVDKLCEAVGAPTPRRIDVNCDVNASAGFRRGVLSFFGSDLVLTIGLPLAAGLTLRQFAGVLAHEFGHFAQGGAMRLTYLIRLVSNWFARVVYERDAWDDWLDNLITEDTHIAIAAIVWITKLVVWFSRRVLWVLMWIGHAVSSLMLRQMEYDADRYEARLAGSETFESTVYRLAELNFANQAAVSILQESWTSRILPDDLPAMVRHHAKDVSAEVKQVIRKAVDERRTGLFDTHPSDLDRIASAKAEQAAGIFHLDVPATVLFRDWSKVCRIASGFHYQAILGEAYDRAKMLPTKDLLKRSGSDDEAFEALARCFRGAWRPWRSVWPNMADWTKSAGESPREALASIRRKLEAATQNVQALAGAYDLAWGSWRNARRAGQLLDAGVRGFDAGGFGLTSANPPTVRDAVAASTTGQAESGERLDQFTRAALHRVTLAMRVLFSPAGEAIPSAMKLRKQARVLGETLNGLQGVEDRLRVLDDRFDAVATLFGHLQGQEANQTLIAEIRQGMSVVARYANDIADQMAVVRFPFDHAEGEVSVGRYLLDQRADPDDINSTMGSAGELLSRALGLQTRCLGRLCRIAERVEQHLDLPPMTVPTAK